MDISIIVVTSPSPTHPSTALIDSVLSSLYMFESTLTTCPIFIIADGYVLAEQGRARTKRGKVTQEMANAYENYLLQLEGRDDPNIRLAKMDRHMGFAMCVKHGLEIVETTFAIILQHDRVFTSPLPAGRVLSDCCEAIHRDSSIRYIGFPHINNSQHDLHLENMGLGYTTRSPLLKIPLTNTLSHSICLKPLLFWYDSNHLAHVSRYLEIYRPYANFPQCLREALGSTYKQNLAEMLLRDGDFIEDRFGQQQRRILMQLKTKGIDGRENVIEGMRWFGTYLLWILPSSAASGVAVPGVVSVPRARVLVGHLRGRQRNEDAVLAAAQIFQDALETESIHAADVGVGGGAKADAGHGEECPCCVSEKQAVDLWCWEKKDLAE